MEMKREDYKAVKHMDKAQLTDYLARVYRRGYEAAQKMLPKLPEKQSGIPMDVQIKDAIRNAVRLAYLQGYKDGYKSALINEQEQREIEEFVNNLDVHELTAFLKHIYRSGFDAGVKALASEMKNAPKTERAGGAES